MITGTAYLALAVPCIAASPLASRLTTHVGRRNTAVAGLLLQAAGLLVLGRLSGGGTLATVLTGFVLIGLGAPIAFVPTIATAMDSRSNDPGLASGRFNASQHLGNAVALAAMATLAASWIARQAHPGGYGRGCTYPPGRLVHCRRSFNVTATLVAGGTRTPTQSGPRPAGATSAWTPGARAGIAGRERHRRCLGRCRGIHAPGFLTAGITGRDTCYNRRGLCRCAPDAGGCAQTPFGGPGPADRHRDQPGRRHHLGGGGAGVHGRGFLRGAPDVPFLCHFRAGHGDHRPAPVRRSSRAGGT
jgi:hypothetical protein